MTWCLPGWAALPDAVRASSRISSCAASEYLASAFTNLMATKVRVLHGAGSASLRARVQVGHAYSWSWASQTVEKWPWPIFRRMR